VKITRATLMNIIKEELEEALDPHRSLAAQAEDEYEEPTGQPGDIEADTVFPGSGPGEWQAAKDAEAVKQRPPREYRREAIKLLASFNVKVGPQEIDIVAWQLYNNAMASETQPAEEPPGKLSFLKKAMKKMGLSEVTNAELSAIRYFTRGLSYDVEALLVQLMHKHDFTLNDVEVMAKELRGLGQGRLDPEPQKRMAESQLQKYIEEEIGVYLDEVYSDKQRDFMCTMKDAPHGERPESLSQGEAEELCKGPMKKPNTKRGK